MGITIREALITDAAEIAALHTNSWRTFYRGIWTDNYLDDDLFNERLNYWTNKLQHPPGNQNVRVALHNNIIVGFACWLMADDPDYGTLLDNLHISADFRGCGIGKLLINDAVSNWIENSQEHKFYCWVLEQNFQARRFYEKMGAINKEVIPLENPDGITSSMTCRYVWLNVDLIIC